MTEKSATVTTALAARSAALFVQLASKFACKTQISLDNKLVNAKSIMGLLSLGVLVGQTVTVITDGVDEEEANAELILFLENTRDE